MNNEHSPLELRLIDLLQRVRDERDEEARAELNTLLRNDPDARKAMATSLVNEQALIHHLRDESIVSILEPLPVSTALARPSRWIQWRPLWAAAAGIVFGMLCTSAVFGYVMPRAVVTAARLFSLVDGSFEKQSGRVASGFPLTMGTWSGDDAKIVKSDAVESKDGRQMLRFMRAEGDPAVPNSPANSCDVYQLVDLRSLKADAGSSEATLEMSAQLLDARDAEGAPVYFSCRVYVFSGSPESLKAEWPLTRKEALAFGSAEWRSTGGLPKTWHEMTAKVLLPPQADFAVVQLVAGKTATNGNQPAEFGEQFADDVQLTLKTQPTLPVRLAQR
ncbi:hypothetical protein BH11VER1_BH11VER1_20260 [soil metagenome]